MESYELQKIGLTKGESKVYLSLSEIGTSTVGPIVKKSKVAYSNVYDILNRLIEKGIVSFIVKNKTKYFQAVSPKNLIDFLSKEEEEINKKKISLKKLLPELESLQNLAPQQKAEIFIGIKGLKAAYLKYLDTKSPYLFFYIHKEEYAKKADLFYLSNIGLYNRPGTRGITNELSKQSIFFKKAKKIKTKYVDYPIPSNIEVCGNKVLMVSWEKTIVAILIESEDIANNIREYFESVWNSN